MEFFFDILVTDGVYSIVTTQDFYALAFYRGPGVLAILVSSKYVKFYIIQCTDLCFTCLTYIPLFLNATFFLNSLVPSQIICIFLQIFTSYIHWLN